MHHAKDRTNTATTIPTTIPMPGRLSVAYFDRPTRSVYTDVPLSDVATGTLVTTGGTITNVHRLTGGRVMVVIASDDGNSAHVLLNADIVRMVAPALYRGYTLDVRGTVSRTTDVQPAGIDAGSVTVGVI